MIFNTYWFVGFCGVFLPLYWLFRSPSLRKIWLLAGCGLFHAHFAGPSGVIPIIVLGLVTYFSALSRRPGLCLAAIVFNVVALVGYKYLHFFAQSVLGAAFPGWGEQLTSEASRLLPAAPPLAISFFTFEFVHYLVEVRRGSPPLRAPADFTLFAIHFPSLVAGPIKRYGSYVQNLQHGLANVSTSDAAAGLQRIALGLFKKLVLADNLTAVIDFHGARFDDLSVPQAWLFVTALAARILLDFSGYSDMAIGLSRMLGIGLPENFNYPYLATSLQDFWQRWHISLSSWIRDYVYIPLGGSRNGQARRLLNGLCAFALCGLWHGPAWNFVLWGLWHAAGLSINVAYPHLLGPLGPKLQGRLVRLPWIGWALTLLHVGLGWLLFFYEPARAWHMATRLFGAH